MRLVLLGAPGPDAFLLEQRATRLALGRLLRDQPVTAGDLDPAVFERSLLTRTPEGAGFGARIHFSPPVASAALVSAGRESAKIITSSIPSLAAALRRHDNSHDWPATALLLIGGIILDIFVGEHLRRLGMVGADDGGWRLWALEDPPAVSIGMRCHHSEALYLGAGVMWIDRGDVTVPLPELSDLAAVIGSKESGARRAAAMLRLRQSRWMDGVRPTFLLLGQDPLRQALDEVAVSLVEHVYREPLSVHEGDFHATLMVSRLIMEQTLARLLASGALPAHPQPTQRLVWHGPDWILFREGATSQARQDTHDV